jgi:hypothetical protein
LCDDRRRWRLIKVGWRKSASASRTLKGIVMKSPSVTSIMFIVAAAQRARADCEYVVNPMERAQCLMNTPGWARGHNTSPPYSVSSQPNRLGGYDYSNGLRSMRNNFGGYDYSNGVRCVPNNLGGMDCQ